MIHVFWPTIREDAFKKTQKTWIDNSFNRGNIVYIPITEKDERCIGVAKPLYNAIHKYNFGRLVETEIIIVASDDMFAPLGWDTWICEQFKKWSGAIIVNDGHQYGECITLPIMELNCLQRLNYVIYHPVYRHLYSDAELYYNLKDLSLIKDLRKTSPLFEHRHYCCGKREKDNYDDVYNTGAKEDENTFKMRIKFPVSERLKV